MMLRYIFLSILFVITPTFSARILGIVPTPSYSHQIVFRPLWKELSLRGHQVTVLTTDTMKDSSLTNLTEIDFQFSHETWNRKMNMNEMAKFSIPQLIDNAIKEGYHLVEEQLQHHQVLDLLKNNTEGFDLVLMEPIFPAMFAFSEKFNCPLIQILSLDGASFVYHSIGNPSHVLLYPDFFFAPSEKPVFIQRLTKIFTYLFMKYYYFPRMLISRQLLIKKYFGENYSNLEDIMRKTSMMFVNSHPVLHPSRALLPNVIQFGGGTHLTTPKPLPKNLQKLLDSAKNGFIYFSLGSNVKSKLLTEQTRKVLLDSFAELPYIVLWKFEQEDLPGKPDNVIISKWFPQQDIFRHPNMRLFITQGGLQSTEEAIYNHIPILGMPFYGDQQMNVYVIVQKGMGLSLDHNTLEKDSFKKAILEIMNNPKYRNKVIEVAELLQDQPMPGLERIVWWTEYVIRHTGAKHLRSPVLDLPGYQYFLLDIIGFSALVISLMSYILLKILTFVYNLSKYFLSKTRLKAQ